MDVPIRCICPPKGSHVRHAKGDKIVLRDRLGFRAVHTIRWAIGLLKEEDPQASGAEIMTVLSEHYLLAGVQSWTLRDDAGLIEPSKANIRALLLADENADVATFVADEADDVYGAVLLPLLNGASTPSPDSPTDESTSPTTPSDPTPPTPLKRSSTSTTPTDSIETTSSGLDGDFRSSPNSASAA